MAAANPAVPPASDFRTYFTRLSDQIYHFPNPKSNDSDGDNDNNNKHHNKNKNDPTTILLYGWGDGTPKNVSKYVDGYRSLFPRASMVVILATTFKAAYQPLDLRTEGMMPVISALFPTSDSSNNNNILIHTMSNAGGINLASTLNAYRTKYEGKTMPHRLMVLDSTPGGVVFSEQVGRWSKAMAIGTRTTFPFFLLPFPLSKGFWWCFLWVNKFVEFLLRRTHAGAWSREAVNKREMVDYDGDGKSGGNKRLYIYSKEDDIIGWEDIELHIADSRRLGYRAEGCMFEGTSHVGHMRGDPDRYWGVIRGAWEEVVKGEENEGSG